MRIDEHRRYTAALHDTLAARADVLGLVALGSLAEQGEVPDDYSDHDFFVVVPPHVAEWYRAEDLWIPERSDIVLRYRETAHGGKVIFRSGHLLEYAVFTPDELALARVNRYRVLLDRADIGARMAEVAKATAARARREAPDDGWLVGQLLGEALVAALREARGEHTSAAQRRAQATEHLVRLVARHVPAEGAERLDGLDASRRVERVYPAITARLVAAEGTGLTHVLAILEVARSELAPRLPGFPIAALDAVQRRVEGLSR
jgi:hypothetical protein